MAINESAKQIIELIKKYGLHPTDAYVHRTKGYKVINRRGTKKIQTAEKIRMKFVLEYTDGQTKCVVRASGNKYGAPEWQIRETYGEVNPNNSGFIYPHAVAQSRAEGRLILELAGLYDLGYFTEDEIDEKWQIDQVVKDREKVAKDSIQATLDAMKLTKGNDTEKTVVKTKTALKTRG